HRGVGACGRPVLYSGTPRRSRPAPPREHRAGLRVAPRAPAPVERGRRAPRARAPLVRCARAAGGRAGAARVSVAAPRSAAQPLVLGLIDAARRSVDVELFVLTDTQVVRALVSAHARGVAVRVLLDPSQRPSDAAYAALQHAGVLVRHYRSGGELLHAKAMVT